MSVLDKTTQKMENVEKKVSSTTRNIKDGAAGVAAGVKGAVKYGVDLGKQQVANRRKARRKIPDKANAADAFNRKLYSHADFDYLIQYLRDSGLATCKNIYTLKSLVEQITETTEAALKYRKIGCLNRLYYLTLRLCIRKRKGLLVYADLTTGKAKKLLNWDTFVEYADFSDSKDVDNIWVPVEDLFPKLRKLPKAVQKNIVREESVSASTENSKEKIGTESDDDTKMFKKNTVNYAEVIVTLYNRIASRTQEVAITDANAFDALVLFSTYLRCGVSSFSTIEDLLAAVQEYLAAFTDTKLKDLISQCSGPYLKMFRQLWGVSEGSGEANEKLAGMIADTYAITIPPNSSYVKVYKTVRDFFEEEIQTIKNDPGFAIPKDLPKDIQQEIKDAYKHSFEEFYISLAKNPFEANVTEENVADALLCLIIHETKKLSNLQFEQYADLATKLFTEFGIAKKALSEHLRSIQGSFLGALKFSMNIDATSSSETDMITLCQIIIQMIGTYLKISVGDTEPGLSALMQAFEAYNATKKNAHTISQKSAEDLFI